MAKFFDYEYRPGEELVLHFKTPDTDKIASEARTHGRAAIKEGLLAARSLLDVLIEAIEQAEKSSPKKTRTKIKVE